VIIPKSNNNRSKNQRATNVSNQNIRIAQPEIPIIPITPISDELFSPEVTRAKEIMGKNFIGPETVMKRFNIPLDKNGVETLKTIPFSEETLITHKNDCILIADFGISLTKIASIMNKNDPDVVYFYNVKEYISNESEAFNNVTEKIQWRLIFKNAFPNPDNKTYNEQRTSLAKNLEIPSARAMSYVIILYYLKTKEYLFFGEQISCSDTNLNDSHISIICFLHQYTYNEKTPNILNFASYNNDDYKNIKYQAYLAINIKPER
jgi:hypothetical protein